MRLARGALSGTKLSYPDCGVSPARFEFVVLDLGRILLSGEERIAA